MRVRGCAYYRDTGVSSVKFYIWLNCGVYPTLFAISLYLSDAWSLVHLWWATDDRTPWAVHGCRNSYSTEVTLVRIVFLFHLSYEIFFFIFRRFNVHINFFGECLCCRDRIYLQCGKFGLAKMPIYRHSSHQQMRQYEGSDPLYPTFLVKMGTNQPEKLKKQLVRSLL